MPSTLIPPPTVATVLKIAGTAVAVPRDVVLLRCVVYCRGGMSSASFAVRGGPLLTPPDPYLNKTVEILVNGTRYFFGDSTRVEVSFNDGLGWCRIYQCIGLRNRGDWFPHTDSNSFSDTSQYNLSADNQGADYLASRAGRTVGQILTDVLAMSDNAAALAAFGFSTDASTTADLAALTMVPACPVYFGGQRFLTAVESFLSSWAPNCSLWVTPAGVLRFLDLRSFTAHTLTMGTDPVLPTPISRDCSGSFSQVEIRGSAIAEPFLFALSNTAGNGLDETPFAWGGHTIAAAKALWTPADYTQPGLAGSTAGAVGTTDSGNCTCPSTTTITCTSASSTHAFPANFWDQTATGRHAIVMLSYSTGTLITSYAARRIVTHTALTAGGSFTCTLDVPLPHLSFDKYTITGTTKDASAVWCVYGLPAWAKAAVAKQTTWPFPFHTSSGLSVTMTSAPTGWLLDSASGNPPYNEYATPVTVDPASGTVRFAYPTYLTVGGHAPTDVRAIIPIYTSNNQVFSPSSSTHAGTCHTVEGISRRLIVSIPAWRDPANITGMTALAADILDSVKDTIIEGTVTYLGMYLTGMDMGCALNIAGATYATGWEASAIPAIPVLECQVEWPFTGPVSHITTMRCSNRRAHQDAGPFLRPDRTGITWDTEGVDLREFGGGMPALAGTLGTASGGYDASMPGLAGVAVGGPTVGRLLAGGQVGGLFGNQEKLNGDNGE